MSEPLTVRLDDEAAIASRDDGSTWCLTETAARSVRLAATSSQPLIGECSWTAAARAGIAEARHGRPIATVEDGVRATDSGEGIALASAATCPTSHFAELLERRRSDRLFGPLSFAELASVLVRCGRTRAFRIEISGAQLESRPLPSAGARHPVSFEIVTADVRGLAAGHWRMRHELCEVVPVGPRPLDLDAKLASMGFAEDRPPAIILAVADFGRALRRYPAGASLVWRDAGVALGGLQLCATDLGLASCIVGSTGLVYPERDPSGLVDIGALALGGLLPG